MDYEEEPEPELTSRRGYQLKDLSRAFLQNLGDSGPIASGKILHFSADMVASGGLLLWEKLCWEYAYDHIGVASPRIFHYLARKFKDLREKSVKLPFESFCKLKEIQEQIAELVLILQGCPKKTKTKIPSVPATTHENDDWLRSVLQTTDKMAVRRVWNRNGDLEQMLHAGNEMVHAITEGATERALFWVKWLLEEDSLIRKKYNSGLSTTERGPPHAKQKTNMGYYLIAVLAEVYKEFAEKGMVRMHEEFQALLDLYRSSDQRNTQRRKMDTIAVMIQILTDVPKWKVPAAPSLVQDPTKLERMVSQAEGFFREVLALPLPPKFLPATVTGLKQKKVKEPTKEDHLKKQLDMMDQMAMSYYKM